MTTNGGQAAKSGLIEGKTMHEDEVQEEHELVDVEVTPTQPAKPGKARLIAGGLAVVAALVAGGFAIANLGDGSEVTAAESADDDNSGAENAAESDVVEEATEATDAATDAAFASDAAVSFGFGPGTVIFADGEFVSLGSGPDGITISRSANGTEWSTASAVGLPEGASAYELVQTDSGWVTVVEIWPEFNGDEPEAFFGPSDQPERFLAFSEDLVNWTTSDLPEVDSEENEYVNVNGIAAVGDQVAVLIQVDFGGPDELRILFENGHIDESNLEMFCGGGFEGDDYVGYSCDFGFAEAIDEVGDAIEDAGEAEAVPTTTIPPFEDEAFEAEEEIVRVSPGDAGYNELFEALNNFDFEMPQPLVAAGTIDGGFTVTELPATGYNSGITSTDDAFVTQVHNFNDGGLAILTSSDGRSWTETGTLEIEGNVDSVTASGDRLLATGQVFDETNGDSGLVAWISDDLGATWSESSIDSDLFSPYGSAIAGPAGFALKIDGALEPYEEDFNDPFADVESADIVVDGFTMTIGLQDGTATLTGPDGVVIHENVSEEVMFASGAENVVRFEGRFDDTIIWLDPETGEDLVTFTSNDIDAAFEELFDFSAFEEPEDFVEPPRGTEIWFSADGVTWTLLHSEETNFDEGGYTGLAGVGDDEVLIRTENFVEPPAELFAFEEEGRQPTEDEIAALDAWHLEGQSIEWTAIPVG